MLFNRTRAHTLMERHGLDAILLAHPNNFVYATDFTAPSTFSFLDRPFLVLFCRDAAIDPVAIVPSWDIDDVRRRSWIPRVIGYTEYATGRDGNLRPSWKAALAEALADAGQIHKLGVEERYLPMWIAEELTARHGGIELVPALGIIRDIRAVKTPEEIVRLKKATEIMEASVDEMLAAAGDGITEAELARVYAAGVVNRGGENIANFVLGFGPEGAYSHAIPGDRKLVPGEQIRFDVGARFKGYHADTAVTRFWKKVGPDHLRAYNAVFGAQRAAAALLGPGVSVRDLHRAATETGSAMVPSFRNEHVGHGLGVEHHENPPLIATSKAALEENMVINVETVFFDKTLGGFGVEDTYLITANGSEQWTSFERSPVLG